MVYYLTRSLPQDWRAQYFFDNFLVKPEQKVYIKVAADSLDKS